MRTFAARQADLDADRYTLADQVRTSDHDPATTAGATAILADPNDKKAAQRALADLWLALGDRSKPAERLAASLPAPFRVIRALETHGLVSARLVGKDRLVKLTGQGQRMALAARRAAA